MKAILIGGLVLAVISVAGGGQASAVPLASAVPQAEASSPLVLLVRHHRHHHRHWRHGHSRGWDDDPAEAYPPGVEGQTTPPPAYVDPSATGSAPDRRSAGGAARPSIRWVDPDRSRR